MIKFKELLSQFDVSEQDKSNVRKLGVHMLFKKDEFLNATIEFICKKYDMPKSMKDTLVDQYRPHLDSWFVSLMQGKVSTDIVTFMMDFNISQTPSGYYSDDRIASIFSFIRIWFQEKLYMLSETDWEYQESFRSYAKMLDLSMYIVNHDYLLYKSGKKSDVKVKDYIIRYAERFSVLVHAILILLLMGMTIGGVSYFVYEVVTLVDKIEADRLFITALGSLLVVWVLVELLHSEVQQLRGDKFKISIFIGVALIAFIRDLLIMTLKHDANPSTTILLIFGVLVLGGVYFLISRGEAK